MFIGLRHLRRTSFRPSDSERCRPQTRPGDLGKPATRLCADKLPPDALRLIVGCAEQAESSGVVLRTGWFGLIHKAE